MVGVDWGSGVDRAWSNVAAFVPKLVGFVIVLVVGYIIVKMIAKIAASVLERVGFDRMVERGGVAKAMAKTEYDPSDVLGKIVFWALMLLVLQMSFGLFGTNPVSDLLASVIAYLPKVIVAILIVVVASAIAAAARELIQVSLGGLSYGPALSSGTGIAILAVGAFAALNELNVAPQIVNGLFYAILAIVAGSAIIAIGGGGVAPMRTRWEGVFARYDEEKPKVQQEMQGAKDRISARAKELADKAQDEAKKAASENAPIGARSRKST
jgi:hypothetical protein